MLVTLRHTSGTQVTVRAARAAELKAAGWQVLNPAGPGRPAPEPPVEVDTDPQVEVEGQAEVELEAAPKRRRKKKAE